MNLFIRSFTLLLFFIPLFKDGILRSQPTGNMLFKGAFTGVCEYYGGFTIGNQIATDKYGNVYVAGYFTNTADFDPSPGVANLKSNGLDDIYFAKYDASGNFLWAKSVGSTG